jgi:arabinose-5-phosphate isomerase
LKPGTAAGTAPVPEAAARAPILDWAREVLELEGAAVLALRERLGPEFERVARALAAVEGQVVTSGVGKSGLVAKKIAATLTSTGTPATFVHPVDAVHGDLGVVSGKDAALLLSKSGETGELLALLPAFRRRGVPTIAVTGNPASTLGRSADHVLDLGRPREAGPEDLVPTSSTTAALALGDALAIVLLRLRGFTREDFVFLHPGGVLGRSALLQVSELMHRGDALPCVPETASLHEALLEILHKRLGMTTVVDPAGRLAGVLTDGDLKRILLREALDLKRPVSAYMTKHPRVIEPGALVAQAVRRMEENEGGAITSLVVTGAEGEPIGVIHLHDCLGTRRERV